MIARKHIYRCEHCGKTYAGTQTCTAWEPALSLGRLLGMLLKADSQPTYSLLPHCPRCGSHNYDELS